MGAHRHRAYGGKERSWMWDNRSRGTVKRSHGYIGRNVFNVCDKTRVGVANIISDNLGATVREIHTVLSVG